ncbi:MAG TPA: hypothetical protein VLS46_02820, partial [Gaiellaceae bacterium]|nr:hypothetical protein [Gaiellaceae bacterium]
MEPNPAEPVFETAPDAAEPRLELLPGLEPVEEAEAALEEAEDADAEDAPVAVAEATQDPLKLY